MLVQLEDSSQVALRQLTGRQLAARHPRLHLVNGRLLQWQAMALGHREGVLPSARTRLGPGTLVGAVLVDPCARSDLREIVAVESRLR